MLKTLVCMAFIAGLVVSVPSVAQNSSTPGVENVAPGVRVIHGDEVPSIGVDTAALEAAIKDKHSFSAASGSLGGDGVASVGPAGTTVHIYKVHDTITAKKYVVILFVKEDVIASYLFQDVSPKTSGTDPQ